MSPHLSPLCFFLLFFFGGGAGLQPAELRHVQFQDMTHVNMFGNEVISERARPKMGDQPEWGPRLNFTVLVSLNVLRFLYFLFWNLHTLGSKPVTSVPFCRALLIFELPGPGQAIHGFKLLEASTSWQPRFYPMERELRFFFCFPPGLQIGSKTTRFRL